MREQLPESATRKPPVNLGEVGQREGETVNAYLRTRVLSAPPEELRLILLEAAVKFASQGADGLRRKDYDRAAHGLASARDIVTELIRTIRGDVAADIAENVRNVYTFIFTELLEAGLKREPERAQKAAELLEYERETWKLFMDKLSQERRQNTSKLTTPVPARHHPQASQQTGRLSVNA